MATFHFRLKSGRNGVDHSAYIARQGFHAGREDLVASGCGNLPDWANGDPKRFWRAAELGERKNGAVYRESVIALPNELTLEQNLELVDDLVSKLVPGKPYQFDIHAPTSSLESETNLHVHLMASDRVDDGIERDASGFFSRYNAGDPGRGGRRKDSGGLNSMELRNDVIAKRKLVADTINHHLEVNGYEARVDHRTLSQRGIKRKPERRIPKYKIDQMTSEERAQYVSVRKLLNTSE